MTDNPRERMIHDLEVYIETLTDHMGMLTRMHDDGVIPDSAYEQEMALLAGEIDAMGETLGHLKRRQAGG